MSAKKEYRLPDPIVDQKEERLLKSLTERYEKMTKPGPAKQLGTRIAKSLPEPVKDLGEKAKSAISEQELYAAAMKVIAGGFEVVQEQAARFSISESRVVKQVNEVSEEEIESLDEVCLARAYDISRLIQRRHSENLAAAFVEGGATGFPGFPGIPFNLVLSTFLYFRAVQTIAMTYGYDVKNDAAEMEIAGQVLINAMSPTAEEGGNGAASLIGKFMMIGEAAAVKQSMSKTWAEIASEGGVRLLIAQMRALANKFAKKGLDEAGKKGLESSVFRNIFEQIGKKLSKEFVKKSIPYVSGAIGALFDTSQMWTIVRYSEIFYAKRFIFEKEERIRLLVNPETNALESEVLDVETLA